MFWPYTLPLTSRTTYAVPVLRSAASSSGVALRDLGSKAMIWLAVLPIAKYSHPSSPSATEREYCFQFSRWTLP